MRQSQHDFVLYGRCIQIEFESLLCTHEDEIRTEFELFDFSPHVHIDLWQNNFIQVKTRDNIKAIHHAGRQLLLHKVMRKKSSGVFEG